MLELTRGWDTRPYEIGTGYGHVAVEVDDAYKACAERGQDARRPGDPRRPVR